MQSQTGILNGLIIIGLITLALVWGVTSLTNEDPLWFLQRFDAQAEAMIIYWDGEEISVMPEEPGYSALMEAFADAVSTPAGFEWQIGFSEDSIAQYQDRFRLLEVRFPEPIQIHTRHPFPEAATYLIPLNETHARWRRLFAFPGVLPYTSGPLNISPASFEALHQAVESIVAAQ